MEGYMHILRADNLDGSEEIWDDPFICPPEEQTCAVAQGSQPTGGNDEYSQHTKSSKKRTKNFTADEDEKLISAWLNVGLDPIESNNQSMSRYWQRMHAAFHEHKDFESDRSETSLMNRWSIINANVSRFCGVYAQVVRRKQSGLTEQDKVLFCPPINLVAFWFSNNPFCWLIFSDRSCKGTIQERSPKEAIFRDGPLLEETTS